MKRKKKDSENASEFIWVPRRGPSNEALKRFASHCPKPEKAMGEASWMGETRQIYDELLRPDVENISHIDLQEVFFELNSGLSCFGRVDNWDSWFYYLLWYLLETDSCSCGELVEYLISASFTIQATCPERPYLQYSEDLLATLAHAIMSDRYWNEENDLKGEFHRVGRWNQLPACTGPLSASLFLCLELLSVDQFDNWLHSILKIDGMYWKANLSCWFVSAHQLVFEPKLFANVDANLSPCIDWEHDYLIQEAFVRCNKTKLPIFFEKLREQLDLPRYLVWIEPLSDDKRIADAFAAASVTERYADYVLTGKKY